MILTLDCRKEKLDFFVKEDEKIKFYQILGGYSQNFFSQILKIFVTFTWILEPIKLKK
jgi:hypothetical protein